jgi:TRAP-type C4-dicarboxylate transport system permease large subunit
VGFGALLYTRFLALTGLSRMLSDTLAPMGLDPLLVMLAVTVIFLILGMFLDPIGIMLITMPVFVPLMNSMGMDLIWFGVLVVKFIEIGMLSPPLGFNVYVVKSVVGDAIPIQKIFRGVGWFLVCDMVVVLLMILFPAIVLFLPNLMRG